MEAIGKLRYVGDSFGVDGLTNGKEYYCIKFDEAMVRIVDDSEEDYLYSIINPRPLDIESSNGKWEIVEDYTGEIIKVFKEFKLI